MAKLRTAKTPDTYDTYAQYNPHSYRIFCTITVVRSSAPNEKQFTKITLVGALRRSDPTISSLLCAFSLSSPFHSATLSFPYPHVAPLHSRSYFTFRSRRRFSSLRSYSLSHRSASLRTVLTSQALSPPFLFRARYTLTLLLSQLPLFFLRPPLHSYQSPSR